MSKKSEKVQVRVSSELVEKVHNLFKCKDKNKSLNFFLEQCLKNECEYAFLKILYSGRRDIIIDKIITEKDVPYSAEIFIEADKIAIKEINEVYENSIHREIEKGLL